MSKHRMPVLLLWAITFSVACESANAAWPTYQGNPAHTGHVASDIKAAHLTLRWQRTDLGFGLNPVAIGGGKVFVSQYGPSPDTQLMSLDASTGVTDWAISPFGRVHSVNPPAYANGKVYIQTGNHGGDTYLHSFFADTGNLAFRAAHSAQWESYYAPTPFAGNVYINGGYYGGAYAFSGDDGTQQWFASLGQYDRWTPAVDHEHAYSYVGGVLAALDRQTGSVDFSITDPGFDWQGWSMDLAPVLGGRDDVLVIHDRRLIRFDLANRDIGWERERNFSGQPSVADGVIYAIDANALTAWDQESSQLLWSWAAPGGQFLFGPMVVTDSHVFVGNDETTYAVDLSSHVSVWSANVGGTLSFNRGTLFVASRYHGTLSAFAVPEPTAFGLLLLAATPYVAWQVVRRRRTGRGPAGQASAVSLGPSGDRQLIGTRQIDDGEEFGKR